MREIDKQFWRRLVRIAKPFFVSELRYRAISLLALLVVFALTINWGVNVLLSYIGRDFITALSVRDKDEFFKQSFRYLAGFAIATPILVFYRYTEERLALLWRRWLSLNLIDKYMSNKAYYELTWDQSIDNPDQRIEADIRSFCSTTLSFFLIILNSCLTVFAFASILWNLSNWLVWGVLAYAFMGTVATYFLGKPLISLNFAQLKKDADYRYKLINVRDNAEAVAFYGVERREVTRIRQRLVDALENLLSIINWNRNLSFFTQGYNYLISIIPTVIVAPLYLDGKIAFGDVTQANVAFVSVLGALSIIVLNFQSISGYAAVIKRLGSFYESLDRLHLIQGSRSQISFKESSRLAFEGVTILTPTTKAPLIRELSFAIETGSLLITGPSGSGKSSVLRVVAGLWHEGSGHASIPSRKDAFFIPQRSYMVLGSFRSQLLYGLSRRGLLESELVEVLRKVELEGLLKRVGGLDAELEWSGVLAAGEQQRLAFARLFLAHPQYAFLDEATTALEPETEAALYRELTGKLRYYVSVGHRAMLSKHHDWILELSGDGGWKLEESKR